MIRLKWILRRWELDSTGPGYGLILGSCKHDNESSSSIKDSKFLDQLGDFSFLKKVSAAWL
jgi:hypothetical protein